ncbi:TetR/AcrR family transcriptional regulator [Streptomyces xiaopingdaonensis]|uniref:TetR/AcrR family transcriptional regulator n=1 Tax=Streptomyces xiaopingdaonensis TaxID=1565415 RepID=UPI00031E1CBF|nr:TetR/AcrR family transcriptional regulator [Streptomyces xiaopingdaonensis]
MGDNGRTRARPEQHSGSGATGTRRRGRALEDAILDAAWEVLVDHGYTGFTFEAVATRAGTSRPVLYRRWPQREDLLLATLAKNWQPVEIPDTGRLRDDAITFLRRLNADRARNVVVMCIQLADYFRDTGTSFCDLRDSLRPSGSSAPLQVIVCRAVERGELPDVPRTDRILNLAFDLVRHDLLMTMDALPDESIVEIVDEVWLPLLKAAG